MIIPFIIHFLRIFTKRSDKNVLIVGYIFGAILFVSCALDFNFFSKTIVDHELPLFNRIVRLPKPGITYALVGPFLGYVIIYGTIALKSAFKKGSQFIVPISIGAYTLGIMATYDMLWVSQVIPMIVPPLLEFGFLSLVLSMAFTLISRYVHSMNELEILTSNLEIQVQQRTQQLVEEKDKLQKTLIDLKETNEKLEAAQAQLVQSEKMATIGTLAGGVAHEINNPLTAILSSAQRILKFPHDLNKHFESASNIEKASHFAVSIIDNLLFYSRKPGAQEASVDLNQIVEQVLNNTDKIMNDVRIVKNLQPLPVIRGSAIELTRLLSNLVNNAYDALQQVKQERKELQIIISTEADRAGVKLKIKDNGSGIAEKDLTRVFDPFFTTKSVGKGTGLGLWLVYRIVEHHCGKIHVKSSPQEGCTEFEVWLPATSS